MIEGFVLPETGPRESFGKFKDLENCLDVHIDRLNEDQTAPDADIYAHDDESNVWYTLIEDISQPEIHEWRRVPAPTR